MKRPLLAGLAVLGLIGGLFAARAVLRQAAFFSLRRIELAGARYLTVSDVVAALAIPEGTSLFDDTGPWAERVRGLAGVVEARVSRRVPGTLRVTIREAQPVALAERGSRLVLVDGAGRVMGFDPTRPAADLPLAPADSAVAGLLVRIREVDPELFGRIQRGSRASRGGGVAVELDSGRLLFRGDARPEDIQALAMVADRLAREGKPWGELDARYLPRIVVRGGGRA